MLFAHYFSFRNLVRLDKGLPALWVYNILSVFYLFWTALMVLTILALIFMMLLVFFALSQLLVDLFVSFLEKWQGCLHKMDWSLVILWFYSPLVLKLLIVTHKFALVSLVFWNLFCLRNIAVLRWVIRCELLTEWKIAF